MQSTRQILIIDDEENIRLTFKAASSRAMRKVVRFVRSISSKLRPSFSQCARRTSNLCLTIAGSPKMLQALPSRASTRKVNFSPTIKAGPWRFIAGQVASEDFLSVHTSPAGLPHHFSDIEVQTQFTLDMLREQLEANETDWRHCHHVRVYLVHPKRDYRGFVRIWNQYFPDPAERPALCFVPTTSIMFPGPLIEIDPTCVAM